MAHGYREIDPQEQALLQRVREAETQALWTGRYDPAHQQSAAWALADAREDLREYRSDRAFRARMDREHGPLATT